MKELKCKCGGLIVLSRFLTDEFLVDCMKCNKCAEILYTPEQTKQLIALRDANKEIQGERKIIKVGSSIAALLPKKVEDYGIHEGEVGTVRVLSRNSLEIRLKKNIV